MFVNNTYDENADLTSSLANTRVKHYNKSLKKSSHICICYLKEIFCKDHFADAPHSFSKFWTVETKIGTQM